MTHDPSYRRILHKMGYYGYQQGLIYHHLNQEGGWNNHHQKCRSFILKAMDFYQPDKITVLGSGWLLELPLTEMVERTGLVSLIDIIHPPEVITQTTGMKNVELVEADITGGLIEEVWKKAGRRTFLNKLRSLGEIIIPEYQLVADPGMVISLNILTQLESQPERFLKARSKGTDDEYINFRKAIQSMHLRLLQKHKAVLITDKAEVFIETGGRTVEKATLLIDLPSGKAREEWIWDFDLKGTVFNKKKSVFKITATLI
jgi:hypothetical protein